MARGRGVWRDLTGRGAGELIEHVTAQLQAAEALCALGLEVVEGRMAPEHAAESVERRVEAAAEHGRRLSQRLARALVTPIDREDLFRVSRISEDVVANLADFHDELRLYRPADPGVCAGPLEAIVGALEALEEAAGSVDGSMRAATAAAVAARQRATAVRRAFHARMAELLDVEQVDAEVLKRRELLRRLDVVGLRVGEVAAVLGDGAVKRT